MNEPLLHFCVLGALIFGADAALHPPDKDLREITVTKLLRQSFIDNFDEDKARAPSDAELQKMIDSWVASEILYREGKALAVDRGDDMIRDRIAYKLQLLIFDQIRVPQPTQEQLRVWFAENHERFDEPERVGFYMTPPSDETTARRRLEDIEAQRESEELQKQTRAVLARPVSSSGAVVRRQLPRRASGAAVRAMDRCAIQRWMACRSARLRELPVWRRVSTMFATRPLAYGTPTKPANAPGRR